MVPFRSDGPSVWIRTSAVQCVTAMAIMHEADHRIDYNLVVPLLAVLEERHVTRAAERCGMSQPALSRALDRARRSLGDDLLVRRGPRYERTPRGERLYADLRELVPRLDAVLADSRFEPSTSRDRFRIVTTDYASLLLVPQIVTALARRAPRAAIDCAPWDPLAPEAIGNGTYDLGIIGLDGLDGLSSEPLFADTFVCVVARDHPIADEPMTLERYAAYPHAVIGIAGGRRQPWIERPLLSRGFKRRIGFTTTSIASAVLALPGTEMICTISRRWCERFARLADVRVIDAPPSLEPLRYGMVWHARSIDDAAVWFRGQVRDVARDLERGERETTAALR